jgi:hypothetical protein
LSHFQSPQLSHSLWPSEGCIFSSST